MTREVKFLMSLALVALTTLLMACQPISYYLQKVDKAYGNVTDGTGQPLESVEVFVHGYQYSELTNGLGDYEIELADGSWTLDFVKEGYTTVSVPGVTVSPKNPRVRVDVTLKSKESGIVGSWNWFRAYAKYTGAIQIKTDGTLIGWEDYAGTMWGDGGTWSQSGDTLTLVVHDTPMDFTLTWLNENQAQLSMPGLATPAIWYRKGFEPDGYLFNNTKYPPLPLSKDTPAQGSLPGGGLLVYQYTAGPNAQNTVISWTDSVQVWVYVDEQTTVEPDNPRWVSSPHTALLTQGQTYYIVVGNRPLSSGDFSITVTE